MFIPFFYLMRKRELNPSIDQWMSLLSALDKGMAKADLMSFYRLCRALLLTSEADFDLFDEVFLEYFSPINNEKKSDASLPEELGEWLTPTHIKQDDTFFNAEHMEILKRLEEAILRILKALEGNRPKNSPIGTPCEACFGCGLCQATQKPFLEPGINPAKDVFTLAQERTFRDFREDKILDIRQFSVALRKLRRYSSVHDLPETEFDVERTINKTAANAGLLSPVYSPPRKNMTKLLVLFDSDGSMWQHAEVSSKLFHALDRINHFRDLKFYYFHNCIYDHLYTSPACKVGQWEETNKVMQNHDSDYRVIYIGDASMADTEMYSIGGNVLLERSNRLPGIAWLKRLKLHYPRSVWLNPLMKESWTRLYGGRTIQEVKRIFPMYELTIRGLDSAIQKL